MFIDNPHCFKLLMQAMLRARSLARESAGSSRLARIAMIAITTSSSISVNPRFVFMAARLAKEFFRCRCVIAEVYRLIAETPGNLPPLAKNYRAFAFILEPGES